MLDFRVFQFCPYFASSKLTAEADLIFCPYQYLIDRRIREAKQITLDGHIVIFDEGHNMEDAARDAASFSCTTAQLTAAAEDFQKAKFGAEYGIKQTMAYLVEQFGKLHRWMKEHGELIDGGTDGGTRNFTGEEIIGFLQELGFGGKTCLMCCFAFTFIIIVFKVLSTASKTHARLLLMIKSNRRAMTSNSREYVSNRKTKS